MPKLATRLFLLGILTASAAEAAVHASRACRQPGARPALNFDLSEERRTALAAAGAAPAAFVFPADACLYRNQWFTLSRRNPRGLPIVWGRARVRTIEEGPAGVKVAAEVTPLLLERTLAPDCANLCEIRTGALPAADLPRLDLRPAGEGPRPELPGARALPLEEVASFPFEKLPAPGVPLVLITESPDVQYAPVLELMRELKQRGHARLIWFYPGAQGLKNFYVLFPEDEPPANFCGDWILTAPEAAALAAAELVPLARAAPAGCAPGDAVRLVRFEKPADTAFVVGIAEVLHAEAGLTLLRRRWFDERETGWIAFIGAGDRLLIESPTGEPDFAPRTVTATIPWPQDPAREFRVLLPSAGAEWRGVLESLRAGRRRRTGAVHVHAPAPRPFTKPLPGVVDIGPEWLPGLQAAGAFALRPASVTWSAGPSVPRAKNLAGPLLREKLAALRPAQDAVVLLGEGLNDREALQLARELLGLGYRRLYWDRGFSLPAPRKFRFDPVPAIP